VQTVVEVGRPMKIMAIITRMRRVLEVVWIQSTNHKLEKSAGVRYVGSCTRTGIRSTIIAASNTRICEEANQEFYVNNSTIHNARWLFWGPFAFSA
jgi:hypothetical protein